MSADSSQAGLGDIVQSVFFSPKAPTAVLLKHSGPWTYGALVKQPRGISHDSRSPDVDAMFLRPSISRALGKGITVGANLESTYDWTSSQWVVPANLTISKGTKIGKQLISFGGGARYYLEKPNGAPDWGLRFSVTLLYPRCGGSHEALVNFVVAVLGFDQRDCIRCQR